MNDTTIIHRKLPQNKSWLYCYSIQIDSSRLTTYSWFYWYSFQLDSNMFTTQYHCYMYTGIIQKWHALTLIINCYGMWNTVID